MSYSGFELSAESREELKKKFPPKFADFIGHHITWQFPAKAETHELPPQGELRVIGYVSDGSLETLIVDHNGSTKRPGGGTLHITWSLDRHKGRKPVDSNQLIKQGSNLAVFPAINIVATPKFF